MAPLMARCKRIVWPNKAKKRPKTKQQHPVPTNILYFFLFLVRLGSSLVTSDSVRTSLTDALSGFSFYVCFDYDSMDSLMEGLSAYFKAELSSLIDF